MKGREAQNNDGSKNIARLITYFLIQYIYLPDLELSASYSYLKYSNEIPYKRLEIIGCMHEAYGVIKRPLFFVVVV